MQGAGVNKKPLKVEEPATPVIAEKKPARTESAPAMSGARSMGRGTFEKAADKVFKNHSGLFRKLSQ
jgi:hypothetical protein